MSRKFEECEIKTARETYELEIRYEMDGQFFYTNVLGQKVKADGPKQVIQRAQALANAHDAIDESELVPHYVYHAIWKGIKMQAVEMYPLPTGSPDISATYYTSRAMKIGSDLTVRPNVDEALGAVGPRYQTPRYVEATPDTRQDVLRLLEVSRAVWNLEERVDDARDLLKLALVDKSDTPIGQMLKPEEHRAALEALIAKLAEILKLDDPRLKALEPGHVPADPLDEPPGGEP